MIKEISIQKVCEEGKFWLLNSGICINDPSSQDYGGVYSWWDVEKKAYAYLYSEISGYYLTWLSYVQLLDQESLIKPINATGTWLTEQAYDSELIGFKYRKYPSMENFEKTTYWFDNGICMNGLLNAYQNNKKSELFFGIPLELGYKLAEKVLESPNISPWAKDVPIDVTNKWSTQNGTFISKAVISLLNLAKLDAQEYWESIVRTYLNHQFLRQEENGRFITDTNQNTTYLHPHLYTLEAFWIAGVYFKDQKYLDCVDQGLDWILRNYSKHGFLSALIGSDEEPLIGGTGTDVISQLLRLLILSKHSPDTWDTWTDLLLKKHWCQNSLHAGTFEYGYSIEGQWHKDQNAWVAMFTHQALSLLDNPNALQILLKTPTLLV